MKQTGIKIIPAVEAYIDECIIHKGDIPDSRKEQLEEIAGYTSEHIKGNEDVALVFICTHNSRRSHMAQIWATVAAHYYGIPGVNSYSGGTEATAFNPRAVNAMREAGFDIEKADESDNPLYKISFTEENNAIHAFSKKYDDQFNPQENFGAIMTCSDADEACPVVIGADIRFSIPYNDPKIADDTPEEAQRYAERCHQIATEMLYIFSKV